ncbi:MAG: peptide ABC transporter [Deltaproteobacteria bacterium SG8_13]|nr:MAG: peptide ABC transporter [Deltaproteobacteria bacterium SG8_13]
MAFYLRKLLRLAAVVFTASALTFLLVALLPGDVAYEIGGPDATAEQIAAIRAEMGLDRNIALRFGRWLARAVAGDLGTSHRSGEPVLQAIVSRLPVTVELLLFSQLIALGLAIPAAIISAHKAGSAIDRSVASAGFATLSIPSYVMALLLIFAFALRLQLLPATGYTPLSEGICPNLKGFILPSLSIALIEWVPLMRVLRSDMIGTLQEDYILMARAKGLPTWKILLTDALKPSSLTLVTVLGLQIGHWIGAAVIIEMIYALPGIGRLLVDAIFSRDFLMVQGCVLVITVAYVVINSAVDLLYAVLDPRIRLEPKNG